MKGFNNHLRQIIILSAIFLTGFLLLRHFYIFLPSLLGAVTLYILSRKYFLYLTGDKKWPSNWTAFLFIIVYAITIVLPIYLAIILVIPKLVTLFDNPVQIMVALRSFADKMQGTLGFELYDPASVKSALQKLANNIPALVTGTVTLLTNLLLMFFILFYMLTNGKAVEKYFQENLIPVKKHNYDLLRKETILMIRANAIGIPLLALVQGSVAMLGYYIFGVNDFIVWGFLTGVASLVPIVGTGLIWIPLVIYLFAIGNNGPAIGLAIYSLVLTGNIDYVARITLLEKIGNVHPVVTVIGVIIGLSMFGFLGLVFGPLLISYFLLMVKIYRDEFYPPEEAKEEG